MDLPFFFCILETNQLILKNFTQTLVNDLHLQLKDQVLIIHRKNYLTFQSWLLLMGGSSNSYCAMGEWLLACFDFSD